MAAGPADLLTHTEMTTCGLINAGKGSSDVPAAAFELDTSGSTHMEVHSMTVLIAVEIGHMDVHDE